METGVDNLETDNWRLYLSIGGLVWYTAIWSIGLLGCRAARKRYRDRPISPLTSSPRALVPGVSILRPLKGLDTNLYENLESSFTQQYPNFELLLSVADEHDQALPVAKELLAKHPQINARIIIGEEVVGVNPKVNNLMRSYREAANDILWVLDSNVTVAPGTLARAVDILNAPPRSQSESTHKRIALVHHVPFAFASQLTLGARIEEAFLNTNHAKMYIAINTVAVDSCVMGKSNLYRRSDIERLNGTLKSQREPIAQSDEGYGLPAFGRFLAEDNMIAGALWHELDLRHDLSCDVAHNAIGNMTFSDYVWRRVRWIRVRKHMTLVATLVEPCTESVVMSAIAASSLKYLTGISPFIFLPVHFALWIFVDLDVYASLADHPLPAPQRWTFLMAWAARELLALPIWMLAIVGDQVEWRGKRYQVLRNGEVRRAKTDGGGIGRWFRWTRARKPDHYDRLQSVP